MIRATGRKCGREITVEIEKGVYRFNGECNAALEHEFKELLDEGLLVMGSYHPDDPFEDSTYIAGILSQWYFDEWVKVEIIGEKLRKVESKKGVLY